MTRQKYTLAPAANRDLDEIWDYIAKDNVDAADRILEEFSKKFDLLAENRFIGREESEFGSGLRMFPLRAYLIFYLSDRNPIEITRVLHSARDIPTILADDYPN